MFMSMDTERFVHDRNCVCYSGVIYFMCVCSYRICLTYNRILIFSFVDNVNIPLITTLALTPLFLSSIMSFEYNLISPYQFCFICKLIEYDAVVRLVLFCLAFNAVSQKRPIQPMCLTVSETVCNWVVQIPGGILKICTLWADGVPWFWKKTIPIDASTFSLFFLILPSKQMEVRCIYLHGAGTCVSCYEKQGFPCQGPATIVPRFCEYYQQRHLRRLCY